MGTGEGNTKLDELSNSYSELSSINEKQEKRVRYLETRATNLVTSYCFYQAIIFFCVARPSNTVCNRWWTPFCLSLLIAIIAGLPFVSTITKWARTQYHYDLNLVELEVIHYQMTLVQNNHMQVMDISHLQRQQVLKPDMFKVYQRYAYLGVTSAALFAFTVVILHASWSIRCNH